MTSKSARYIPALRFNWLTPFYDPILSWMLREGEIKNVRGLLPERMRAAGFELVEESCYFTTIFGSLSLAYGRKSG